MLESNIDITQNLKQYIFRLIKHKSTINDGSILHQIVILSQLCGYQNNIEVKNIVKQMTEKILKTQSKYYELCMQSLKIFNFSKQQVYYMIKDLITYNPNKSYHSEWQINIQNLKNAFIKNFGNLPSDITKQSNSKNWYLKIL